MVADAAQLRAVSKTLSMFHDRRVRHLPGCLYVAFEIAMHMVIAAKFIQRFQNIARFA